MQEAPKVSILVPIYNVERYLRQCLDSLTHQTLREIEILLLDDGSTDGSGAICDEYAAADSRIRVLHKPNSGYGATMNCGLDMARGEYIGILESDDWAESDMYETMYALAAEHHVQIVKGNYYTYTEAEGDHLASVLPENILNKVICPQVDSAIFFVGASIWAAIYERQFLTDNGIRFLETPGASYQDTSFNFKVWARAESVWLTAIPYVHYRQGRDGSSVTSKAKVFCIRDEWDEVERYMSQYPEDKTASARLRSTLRISGYMWNIKRLTGKNRELFRRLYWKTYKRAWRRGELKGFHTNYLDKLRFTRLICPPWQRRWRLRYYMLLKHYPAMMEEHRTLRFLRKLSRIVVKRKVNGRFIRWKLFGAICVSEWKTGYELPGFRER